MEADSVNSAILTEQANEETVDLFVREVFREMTTKAGQKCTVNSSRFRSSYAIRYGSISSD